jgi:hypothetical protein
MMNGHSKERTILIGLNAFLAVTAIAGGIGLLTGWLRTPVDMLAGSPFRDYTIPGLALLVLVGGSALAATVLLLRRHEMGIVAAAVAGAMIICFEIVEVLVIGLSTGLVLQVFYFVLGVIITVLAVRLTTPAPGAFAGAARP